MIVTLNFGEGEKAEITPKQVNTVWCIHRPLKREYLTHTNISGETIEDGYRWVPTTEDWKVSHIPTGYAVCGHTDLPTARIVLKYLAKNFGDITETNPKKVPKIMKSREPEIGHLMYMATQGDVSALRENPARIKSSVEDSRPGPSLAQAKTAHGSTVTLSQDIKVF